MTLSIPPSGCASPEAIAALVERYGKLPTDYLQFLSEYDGAAPPENVVQGTDYNVGVRTFLPAANIVREAQSIENFSSKLMPIADDDCGNLLCIGTTDQRIYFWDHETNDEESIARNFEDLLEKLEPFDISEMQIHTGEVKSVWIDPNFKPKFR